MAETKAVIRAKEILYTKTIDPEEILDLVKNKLKNEKAFDYARKICELANKKEDLIDDRKLFLDIAHQQSLCTYKDQNLNANKKYDLALKILDEAHHKLGESLETTKNQETLGQAGAIFKYRWEFSGQKKHLELSLNYYLRGYQQGVTTDYGYNAVNAVFVLKLLASLESAGIENNHPGYEIIETRQNLARQIGEKILEEVPAVAMQPDNDWLNEQWWFLVTLGEACFGLGQYDEAEIWFKKAASLENIPDWEKESTTRQLATLARIQLGNEVWKSDFEKTSAGRTLLILVGQKALIGMLLGKVGLALSGGGFRASLFHIGVLARLAELDILRHVEVLSCVSGGSIIGAYYYLELRKLLKETQDEKIDRTHYIAIVHRITKKFLEGVQRNLRTRVAAEFSTNLKMIVYPGYSRTMRIGELYEEELFSKVDDGEGNDERYINELFITPKNEESDFSPKLHNWRREANAPILILNATTLNTGHNWQFTASWMGEPPANIDKDIDTNYRLRRMYYSEAPKKFQNYRLGHAVAASSCVPGLFEPISLTGLYPRVDPKNENTKRIVVRLVDGGVHDNQGIASLLEQGCSVMMVSDASGQMESQNEPAKAILGVPMRSNSILMARVREAEYRELDALRKSKALRGFMFIHLKKELESRPVDWATCKEPPMTSKKQGDNKQDNDLPGYKIKREIQQSLADLRTDLDSFSQAEAHALMLSGYRMTEDEFPKAFPGYPLPTSSNQKWKFFALDDAMKNSRGHEREYEELQRLLRVGSSRVFKIWKLYKPLKVIGWIIGTLVILSFLWLSWNLASYSLITVGMIGIIVAVLLVSAIISKKIVKIDRFRDTLIMIVLGIGMSLAGWIIARLHLHIFDKCFKKYGKVSALKQRAETKL